MKEKLENILESKNIGKKILILEIIELLLVGILGFIYNLDVILVGMSLIWILMAIILVAIIYPAWSKKEEFIISELVFLVIFGVIFFMLGYNVHMGSAFSGVWLLISIIIRINTRNKKWPKKGKVALAIVLIIVYIGYFAMAAHVFNIHKNNNEQSKVNTKNAASYDPFALIAEIKTLHLKDFVGIDASNLPNNVLGVTRNYSEGTLKGDTQEALKDAVKIIQLMSVKYPLIQQYNFECYDKAQNEFLSFDINLKDVRNIKDLKPSEIKGLKGVHYWQTPYSIAKMNELAAKNPNNNEANSWNSGTTASNSITAQSTANNAKTNNNTNSTDSTQSSTNNSSNTSSDASNNQNSTSNTNGTDSTQSNVNDLSDSNSNESTNQNAPQSGTAAINTSTGNCSASDVENAINLVTMPDGEATVQNVQNAGQGTYIINLNLSGDSDSEDGEDCLEDAIAIVQNLNQQYPNISCYVFQGFDSSNDKVVFFDLSPSDYGDLSSLTPDQISNNPNSQYWFLYGN